MYSIPHRIAPVVAGLLAICLGSGAGAAPREIPAPPEDEAPAVEAPAAEPRKPPDLRRLDAELTPWGAQRAGNASGEIPAWSGAAAPPEADETPLFEITAANMERYADRLSEGQHALLHAYPASYRMPVYRTRRSFANPPAVYAATREHALQAHLEDDGNALVGAAVGVPFPIPDQDGSEGGAQVIWNHKTRYLGRELRRWANQFTVGGDGDYRQVRLLEELFSPYAEAAPEDAAGMLRFLARYVALPAALGGSAYLLHEPLDARAQERWTAQYAPGQWRLRTVGHFGYDQLAIGAEGLLLQDQFDSFNGALDRYRWKLIGLREMYVPANATRLQRSNETAVQLIGGAHLDPAATRYELRRVWRVEASLKAGATHTLRRRHFFVDEDGWQIRVVDLFDRNGTLVGLQEAHTAMATDVLAERPVLESVYDLAARRYLVTSFNGEVPAAEHALQADDFDRGSARKQARQWEQSR